MKLNLNRIAFSLFFSLIVSNALVLVANAATGKDGQEVFTTAEEALSALKTAVKSGDSEHLAKIFGKHSRDYFFTGDPVGDAIALKNLSRKLDERAELLAVVSDNAGASDEQWYLIRYGIEGWDMHFPLVSIGKGWSFATQYATEADLRRRRAFNEVATVDTLHALVAAQKEYKSRDRNGDGILEFAQKFGSSPGKQDGLYWPSKDGQEASPIDGMVLKALQDGYKPSAKGTPTYFGYVYKMLTAQGGKTRGGKKSYLKDDHMTEGFGILAYPVAWKTSGDSTFFIGADGQAWKKNLGVRTESLAPKIESMDMDQSWVKVSPLLGGENSRRNW